MTGKEDKEPFSSGSSRESTDLWQNAVKDTKRLKKRDAYIGSEARTPEASNPVCNAKNKHLDTGPSEPLPVLPAITNGQQTDRRTEQRLKRGKLEIEATLDLHGQTRAEAYESLVKFTTRAYGCGKKCILVITGKGAPAQGEFGEDRRYGVLRESLTEWTQMPPLDAIVLKVQEARQKHGGAGAFYLLLRKKRRER